MNESNILPDVKAGASVLVAMSGGVDSSVAAALLKQSGLHVVGAHMVCWEGCDLKEEKRDALRVALQLEIPLLSFDFCDGYRERVFDYMIREYAAGRTPNPDVMCNREIKFGLLLDKARELGIDCVATGHYARLDQAGDSPILSEAVDKGKDQSYFLWAIDRQKLRHCIFPVGNYTKGEVRELARRLNLTTADKKDSQGLCFVGKVNFGYFLRSYLPCREGVVINSRGKILGKHDGVAFYTIGQRHGLGIGGLSPYYVAEKNLDTNTLIVGEGANDPVLFKREIRVERFNWLSNFRGGKCAVRIRYRQPKVSALLEGEGSSARVLFDTPQRGVAPGQSAVFYKEERVLGGGVIV
ncbi:MAG: tRNA 2-thiouridine(34) synthase MnmA [Alphaproteobacteria bacterium]